MAKWAIALTDLCDNDTEMVEVYADNERSAVLEACRLLYPGNATMLRWAADAPSDLPGLKRHFFNGDMILGVLALK